MTRRDETRGPRERDETGAIWMCRSLRMLHTLRRKGRSTTYCVSFQTQSNCISRLLCSSVDKSHTSLHVVPTLTPFNLVLHVSHRRLRPNCPSGFPSLLLCFISLPSMSIAPLPTPNHNTPLRSYIPSLSPSPRNPSSCPPSTRLR